MEARSKETPGLVSVIIPTHNRKELLIRAVDSVLTQTYADLEILVADDASSDGTVEACRQLVEKDARIQVFRSEKNIGAGAVRNRAIELARGQYVCFLDDDDIWYERKLERQVPFIEDYSIVACRSRRIDGYVVTGGLEIKTESQPEESVQEEASISKKTLSDIFFNNGELSPSCVMIKRSHLLEIDGFDEALPSSQGRDLFVRLVSRYGDALLINEHLAAHFQQHGLPRITSTQKSLIGGWMELEKHKHLMSRRLIAWRTYMLCMKEAGLAVNWRSKLYWTGKSIVYMRPWRIMDQLKVLIFNLFIK